MHAQRQLTTLATGGAVALLVAGLGTLSSCAGAGAGKPFAPPLGLEVTVGYHAGGIVAGPQAAAPEAQAFDPTDALALSCELLYVELMPEEELEPVESIARFVVSIEAGEPIVPFALTLSTASIAEGAAALALRGELAVGRYGRTFALPTQRGALPRGTSARISAVAVDARERQPGEAPPRLESNALGLYVSRVESDGGESIELGLGLRDRVAMGALSLGDGAGISPPSGAPRDGVSHELMLLNGLEFDGETRVALVVPSPFESGPGAAFVLFLELRRPPEESADAEAWRAHAVLVDEVHGEVMASAAQVADAARVEDGEAALLALMSAVLDAQRPGNIDEVAMFGLATGAKAWVACDLLLVGDKSLHDELVRIVLAAKQAGELALDSREAFGWLLDRSAWEVIAERLLTGEGELVMDSMALRHGGELARYPATILEGIEDVADGQAYQRFLEQENLAFLRDSHPAARVRAYEWLRLNAMAPKDYDPLGEPDARRAALEAFYVQLREKLDAPAAGGGGS